MEFQNTIGFQAANTCFEAIDTVGFMQTRQLVRLGNLSLFI
jgi:hypothetical protein